MVATVGSAEREVIEFHIAISGGRASRQYKVRIPMPVGTNTRDFAEHCINVLGASVEVGFALLDALFSRTDHRV